MKKMITVLAVLVGTSIASADPIWSENFDDASIAHQANGVSWLWDGTEAAYSATTSMTGLGNGADRTDSWALGGTSAHVAIANGALGVGNVADKYRAAVTVLGDLSSVSETLTFSFDILSLGATGFNGAIEVWTNSGFTGVHNEIQWVTASGGGSLYSESDPYGSSSAGMNLAGTYDVDAGTIGTQSIEFEYTAGDAVMLRFASDTQTEGAFAFEVDNLSIASIPEPATFGLFGLGAIATLIIRKKNRG